MVQSNIPSALSPTVGRDLTADADELNVLDGVTAGTVTASKALVVGASKQLSTLGTVAAGALTVSALTVTPVARTATADGLTTGIIADAGMHQVILVTSAGANNIITLPTPTPGVVIDLLVGANGYELRSSAPATVLIGGGAGGAAVESAIPANSWAHLVCVDATHWVGLTVTAATLAVVEAAA